MKTNSPNRKFFLRCLYLLAGNCVRQRLRPEMVAQLKEVLNLVTDDDKADVLLWVKRTNELLKKPSRFRYDDWCGGGLAVKEGEW